MNKPITAGELLEYLKGVDPDSIIVVDYDAPDSYSSIKTGINKDNITLTTCEKEIAKGEVVWSRSHYSEKPIKCIMIEL